VVLHQIEFLEFVGPLDVANALDFLLAEFVVVKLSHRQDFARVVFETQVGIADLPQALEVLDGAQWNAFLLVNLRRS
jgi:hypothetical protein